MAFVGCCRQAKTRMRKWKRNDNELDNFEKYQRIIHVFWEGYFFSYMKFPWDDERKFSLTKLFQLEIIKILLWIYDTSFDVPFGQCIKENVNEKIYIIISKVVWSQSFWMIMWKRKILLSLLMWQGFPDWRAASVMQEILPQTFRGHDLNLFHFILPKIFQRHSGRKKKCFELTSSRHSATWFPSNLFLYIPMFQFTMSFGSTSWKGTKEKLLPDHPPQERFNKNSMRERIQKSIFIKMIPWNISWTGKYFFEKKKRKKKSRSLLRRLKIRKNFYFVRFCVSGVIRRSRKFFSNW